MNTQGFFVDWNGEIRSTDSPGKGYKCLCFLAGDYTMVEMITQDGEVIYQAVYYQTVEDIEKILNRKLKIVY